MAHYARVINNFVTHVIVADQAFIDSGAVGPPAEWIQTSYNTKAGIHYGQDGTPDGGVALRKNFASPGYMYMPEIDAFVPPKPFAINGVDWALNQTTGTWEHPVQQEMINSIQLVPPGSGPAGPIVGG